MGITQGIAYFKRSLRILFESMQYLSNFVVLSQFHGDAVLKPVVTPPHQSRLQTRQQTSIQPQPEVKKVKSEDACLWYTVCT